MIPTSLIPLAQTAIAVPAAAVDAVAALKSGQIVTARVLEILGQSLARLDIGGSKIDVRSQTPLEIGTQIQLKVERSGTLTRLVPVQPQAARSAVSQEAAIPSPPVRSSAIVLSGRAAPPAPSSQNAALSNAPASSPLPAPATANTAPAARPGVQPAPGQVQMSNTERMDQAARQLQQQVPGSRGPAFNPVRALQAQLAEDATSILRALKTVGASPPGTAKAALSAEAGRAPAVVSNGHAASGPALPGPARQALVQQTALDAGRQASAAPLFADAAQLLANAPDKLPMDVRDALTRLLGFRVPADKPVSGQSVRSAFIRSGVLLEAKLGEAVRQMEAGQKPAMPGADLKSTLLNLKQKLSQFLKAQNSADVPAKPSVPAQKASLPPPPVRSGPLQGQSAAETALSARMSGPQMAQVLMEETRSAISRLRLFQNASLPAQGETVSGRTALPRLEWNFEIPLAFGGRTDMAQLRIEGEGGEDIEPARRLWSVHVAMDTEETGNVSGAVMLQGQAISVHLMAEREAMADVFKAREKELEAVLKEAGLEVERLHIRHGIRQSANTAPGHMVDQTQ